MKCCITALLVLSDPEHILCEYNNLASAPTCLISSTAIRYDKKNHGYFSEDIYVGLCLFSPLQGKFYMSTFNTFLSATWQGICQGHRCLRFETIHACEVCLFSLFGPTNAQATDGICKGHAWCPETQAYPEVFQPSLFEAGNTSEKNITL